MNQEWEFTIWGDPIGKPRMTQRDKWDKRPAVVRYWNWANSAKLQTCRVPFPPDPLRVEVIAYLPIPSSWSQKKKSDVAGIPHRQKPDADNILKAVCDALFAEDKCIAAKRVEKRWDDGIGPRVNVCVFNYITLCPNTESSNDGEAEAGEGATETAA